MTITIPLPDKLDTRAAPELLDTLASLEPGNVLLDGRSVKTVGTLCGQMLWALQKERAAIGEILTIDASEAMIADLKLLGLHTDLILKEIQNES